MVLWRFVPEKVKKSEKFRKIFNFTAILVIPDVSSSTKKVYANYKHDHALYKRQSAQIKSLLRKNRIDLIPRNLRKYAAEKLL